MVVSTGASGTRVKIDGSSAAVRVDVCDHVTPVVGARAILQLGQLRNNWILIGVISSNA